MASPPKTPHAPPSVAEAAQFLLSLRAAQESFLSFVQFWYPNYELAEFQVDLINTLDALEKDTLLNDEGEVVDNLLITMPPRFAKSTFATVMFPSYYMARDPARFVMSCSYNSTLATDFGRQVRTIVEDPRMAQVFPNLGLSKESRAADVWRTTDHGAYFAVGIGGTTSGRPANCFASGTMVLTPAGERPIETLRPGDLVMASDPEAGTLEPRAIRATQSRMATTRRYTLSTGRRVVSTPDHPVWCEQAQSFLPIQGIADGNLHLREVRHDIHGEAVAETPLLLPRVLPNRRARRGFLRRLLGDLRAAAVRAGQAWPRSQVLLARLHRDRPDAARGSHLPRVQHDLRGQAALEEAPVLHRMRGQGALSRRDRSEHDPLRRVWAALSQAERQVALLLDRLQERLALPRHDWALEPALPARGGQPSLCPGLEAGQRRDPQARPLPLHLLRDQGAEPGRASHRHAQGQQRAGEPDLHVPQLPYHPAQDAWGGPARILRVEDAGVVQVHDIDVEGLHNFVAEGVLVHNCLIVDDPIKSRDDAESATQRNKTWNYYASALSTRLQPTTSGQKPKQIIVLTRWHVDDIASRLQRSADWREGRWKHVNYQAIIKRPVGKLISRSHLPRSDPRFVADLSTLPKGQRYFREEEEVSLWPERFPIDDLQRRRRLNPREFASLYQQEPYIEGGNLLKTEWWQHYPVDLKPERFVSLIIAADTAFKKSEQSDYSVALIAGVDRTGDIYIVDVIRGRYEFPDLKTRMIQLNAQWRGKGLRGIYVEDKASGQSLIQELKRQSGLAVIPYKTVNDKVARANAVLPLIEGGRVYLPEEAPWLDAFIEEATQFPGGAHDDQVDALTMALDVLARTAISPEHWDLQSNIEQSLNAVGMDPYGKSLSQRLTPAKSALKSITSWRGWGQ